MVDNSDGEGDNYEGRKMKMGTSWYFHLFIT